MEQSHHGRPGHAGDGGGLDRARGRHAQRLPGQAALAEEAAPLQDADDRFLASRGDDGEPDPALLDEEDRVGGVPLGEDDVLRPVLPTRLASLDTVDEAGRIEGCRRFLPDGFLPSPFSF